MARRLRPCRLSRSIFAAVLGEQGATVYVACGSSKFACTTAMNADTVAVPECFGTDVDFAQLTKMFGDYGQFDTPEARYSPPRISGVISKVRQGDPDPDHISTSFIERQNLTMRMAMRRFTRLTNAFSKKVENLRAAVSLHFAHYNFLRVHRTLRVTPAMEARVSDRLWSLDELVERTSA